MLIDPELASPNQLQRIFKLHEFREFRSRHFDGFPVKAGLAGCVEVWTDRTYFFSHSHSWQVLRARVVQPVMEIWAVQPDERNGLVLQLRPRSSIRRVELSWDKSLFLSFCQRLNVSNSMTYEGMIEGGSCTDQVPHFTAVCPKESRFDPLGEGAFNKVGKSFPQKGCAKLQLRNGNCLLRN